MIARRRGAACILITLLSLPGEAQQPPSVPAVGVPVTPVVRDGQRDFDFEIGTWRTHLKRLVKPLSGSTTWAEYEGTTVVRKVLDGRANLVELRVKGPVGQIEGLSLRLYNTQSRQWSLHFSNIASGAIELPTVGEFRNGRGEFYGQDTLNGRVILVRFVVSVLSPASCRFEQAFSVDGGKTWEVNWIATDTRLADAPAGLPAPGLPLT
jgi:hypothetical protein